jgi:hypothetical protein
LIASNAIEPAMPDIAAAMRSPPAAPSTGPESAHDIRGAAASPVLALEGAVVALRAALARERGRADRAEAEAREARQTEVAARDRAAHAEGARNALQASLQAAEAALQRAEARVEIDRHRFGNARAAFEAGLQQQAETWAAELQHGRREAEAQVAAEAARADQAQVEAKEALAAWQRLPLWRRVFCRPG